MSEAVQNGSQTTVVEPSRLRLPSGAYKTRLLNRDRSYVPDYAFGETIISGQFGSGSQLVSLIAARELAKESGVTDRGKRNSSSLGPDKSATKTVGDLLAKLERLTKGWAGAGSVPPTPGSLADATRAASAFPPEARLPNAEVDPEDGFLTLIWDTEDAADCFALVFVGEGSVIGTMSRADGIRYEPWTVSVDEEAKLARRLDEESVSRIISA